MKEYLFTISGPSQTIQQIIHEFGGASETANLRISAPKGNTSGPLDRRPLGHDLIVEIVIALSTHLVGSALYDSIKSRLEALSHKRMVAYKESEQDVEKTSESESDK
jgi:hypothetical protein